MLFFGLRLLTEFNAWVLSQNFGIACCQLPEVIWEVPNLPLLTPLVLLAVSYLFVRRLGHDLLSKLWLYTITVGAIGLVTVLPALVSFHSVETYVWLLTTTEAVRLVTIVWFARNLSAVSFRHSLLFIGLATVLLSPGSFIPPQFHMDPAVAWPLHVYITLLVGGTLLRGLAVWLLIKGQPVTSSTRTIALPLIAMVLPSATLSALVVNVWPPFPMYYEWILPTLMVPALAVVLTYAVRVREPEEPQPARKTSHTLI